MSIMLLAFAVLCLALAIVGIRCANAEQFAQFNAKMDAIQGGKSEIGKAAIYNEAAKRFERIEQGLDKLLQSHAALEKMQDEHFRKLRSLIALITPCQAQRNAKPAKRKRGKR